MDVKKSQEKRDLSLYRALKDLCGNNSEFFKEDDSEYGQRLHGAFLGIVDHLETVIPLVCDIREIAQNYDFDSSTPGNGYRSFVAVVDMCVSRSLKLSQWISYNRNAYVFRKAHYMREVEACSHVMASLGTCLQHLKTLISWSTYGSLFPDESHSPKELLTQAENINQYCFYGRCLGFQFCTSMRKVLTFLSVAMASYSEIYYGDGGFFSKATNSLWTGGKYLMDPELRSRRIVNISQYASVDFCKSFWLLAETELMTRLPVMVSPGVSVNCVIAIPPETLELEKVDGSGQITVPTPNSHLGPAPVNCRLISAVRRRGMIAGDGTNKHPENLLPPPSKGLVIHCHGGGFVAQSSRSHESYLRDWAVRLDVPILSIDYSLAPEAPFPRALEEVLFAYCWALRNASILGSTAERVVLVGDSAGANLNLGVAMKCEELGIRIPDGLFVAYVPVLVAFVPSSSRLLCLMDPLLPFGFMMQCLKAYAGQRNDPPNPLEEPLKSTSNANSAEGKTPEVRKNKESLSSICGLNSLEAVSVSDLTITQPQSEAGNSSSIDEHVLFEIPQDVVSKTELTKKLRDTANKIAGSWKSGLWGLGLQNKSQEVKGRETERSSKRKKLINMSAVDDLVHCSPSDQFQFTVPKDPYLSPYWASDEVLKKLPPISILSLQFDPCLDDCVMFAKKLKGIGNDVQLDVLDGLPHGFLNFSLVSKEAHEGSLLCVKRILKLLDMDGLPAS